MWKYPHKEIHGFTEISGRELCFNIGLHLHTLPLAYCRRELDTLFAEWGGFKAHPVSVLPASPWPCSTCGLSLHRGKKKIPPLLRLSTHAGICAVTVYQCLGLGHPARADGPTPVFLGQYFSTCGSHTSWRIPVPHPDLSLSLSGQGQASTSAG